MYKGKTFLALIPARGGSKGIKGKNLHLLAGKPLLSWTLEAARQSKLLDGVFTITDDPAIAKLSRQSKVEVLLEPKKAGDKTQLEKVLLRALKDLGKQSDAFDHIVLLQPTSPLRTANDIDKAIRKLVDTKLDSLLSVSPNKRFIWDHKGAPVNYDYRKRPLRQEMGKRQFAENGAIYVTSKKLLLSGGVRLGGKVGYFIMPEERSVEIDAPHDLWLAEAALRELMPMNQDLSRIKLLVLDVDGVMTDGSTYYGPKGEVLKKFNKRDGKGIELWHKAGGLTAIITGESGPIIQQRAKDLNIPHVFEGHREEKLKAYGNLKDQLGVTDQEVAFIGDDVQDISLLTAVGFAATPADATPKAKGAANYVCQNKGAQGCVREVIDILLRDLK